MMGNIKMTRMIQILYKIVINGKSTALIFPTEILVKNCTHINRRHHFHRCPGQSRNLLPGAPLALSLTQIAPTWTSGTTSVNNDVNDPIYYQVHPICSCTQKWHPCGPAVPYPSTPMSMAQSSTSGLLPLHLAANVNDAIFYQVRHFGSCSQKCFPCGPARKKGGKSKAVLLILKFVEMKDSP
jgi:hypothetical protein